MKHRLGIEVRGIVQGVGFRPYIYRLAHQHNLTGNIRNSGSGALIEVQGVRAALTAFLESLPREAPPLAQIHSIRDYELPEEESSETSFAIIESLHAGHADTLIAPDIATCADCTSELLDPANRRHRYPFINCTNCGPRFTITRGVPCDRSITSMASFQMCALCQCEYDDPFNRRFHAQPNACWTCGPQLTLVDNQNRPVPGDPIATAIRLLQQGNILALKGLGGFHLAVDATQPTAVAELRKRKHRGEKPLALMVPTLEAASEICEVSTSAAALLASPQRPIVLLPKRSSAFDALAPDTNELGIFLPYTPLHHLLFASPDLTTLIMTSGNLSDEPIAIDNAEALARLSPIADYFLLHNRDILLRCDDSVLRSLGNTRQFIRRSRGYVPAPIQLGKEFPSILAVGGELKNTICLSRGQYAFPGQHIGDLQELSAFNFFQESIAHFQRILEVKPHIIAHDLHPGYLTTQWAKSHAALHPEINLVGVQHHHAHIASCMAEHQLEGQVIGIALDGTGYGTDGHIWGGELLIADLQSFQRAAHFAYIPMPGGEKAIHEPWRMAVSYLWQTFGPDWREHLPASTLAAFPPQGVAIMEQLLQNNRPSILTSSCGRLFDAVAALILRRMSVTFEAQAAIALESVCSPKLELSAYPFAISGNDVLLIETQPLFRAIAQDLTNDIPPATMSRRFHDGIASILTEVTTQIARRTGLNRVCLSGGVFNNAILSQRLSSSLTGVGMSVFAQTQIPAGDGGLSLGQLIIAANQT
jgi:hydrogenase maturation protein HypF